jgi:hypothetical protein
MLNGHIFLVILGFEYYYIVCYDAYVDINEDALNLSRPE